VYYPRIQKTYLRQRWPRKRIALLVSKQAGERTPVLVSYHRVLGLVAAFNKLSKTKNLPNDCTAQSSFLKDNQGYFYKVDLYLYISI
jgi:hypothetical protein